MNNFADNVDRKIINILLDDADYTTKEISKKCNIAIGTVHNRIQKMKKNGVIKKKTIIVDYEKLGYNIEVMIALRIKRGQFMNLAEKLSKHPNVFLVIDMTGDYDAEILARFKTRRGLDELLKKLQKDGMVELSSTRLILNIHREKEVKC